MSEVSKILEEIERLNESALSQLGTSSMAFGEARVLLCRVQALLSSRAVIDKETALEIFKASSPNFAFDAKKWRVASDNFRLELSRLSKHKGNKHENQNNV